MWDGGWMLPKIVEDFAPNLATKFAFFGQNWRPSSPVLLLSLFTFSPALFLLARQDDRCDDAANRRHTYVVVLYRTALIK